MFIFKNGSFKASFYVLCHWAMAAPQTWHNVCQNTWYNFFLNDRSKLDKLVSSVPVKPIEAIFFGQQITSQSSDQRVGSRTGDRRKRFHTFQISRHFCSTVFCREMEYIERASCNTFYTFQNKHKSISIYRILRCCVLKKNQNVVKVMKLASPTRDQ